MRPVGNGTGNTNLDITHDLGTSSVRLLGDANGGIDGSDLVTPITRAPSPASVGG